MFIAHSYSQKLTQPKYTSNSNMDFKSIFGDFPGGSAGKKSAWVRSLGWEDPLEKGKATHSSILA